MDFGYENMYKKEFENFLRWYGSKREELIKSNFLGKVQYKNNKNRRIAYIVPNENEYLIAEDLYADFYHSYYDK